MNLRAGRLLCVGIRGAVAGESLLEKDLDACAAAGVGGVILFDVDVPSGGSAPRNIIDPRQTARLVEHVRGRLGEDIFVAIDQEGGRVARLKAERGFEAAPSASAFALLDAGERADTAAKQAAQLRGLGIDLNFGPCVDLAIESTNEIVVRNGRSYGDDVQVVIEAATAVLDAHAAAGVGACLKHFPGHGSSLEDTHNGVVDITDTWRQEDEMAPYRALAGRPGVAVMVAHLVHRMLDAGRPASLSPVVIDALLRGELGFDGVVVTDSIDMGAITGRWDPVDAAVAAVEAGCDLVVDGFNLIEGREHPALALAEALADSIDENRIDESCARLDRFRAEIGTPR